MAAVTAWASILLARVVPLERLLGPDGLKRIAAASLVLVALVILGVPLPTGGVWVALGSVTVLVAVQARLRSADGRESAGDAAP